MNSLALATLAFLQLALPSVTLSFQSGLEPSNVEIVTSGRRRSHQHHSKGSTHSGTAGKQQQKLKQQQQQQPAQKQEPPPEEQEQPQNRSTMKFRQEMLNYKDSQYYGEIRVGSQKLHAVLDTGSTELVVLSDKCKHNCGKTVEALFHASGSASYKRGALALGISYGSGDLRGMEAYDTVSIGPFTSHDVPFWEATDANMPILASSEFQAIVGLGPIPSHVSIMEPGSSNNNLSYALLLRKMEIPRYSVCLKTEPGSPGYVTWNDDAHLVNPELFTMVPVVGSNYWLSKLTDVALGTKPLNFCDGGCGAIVDSGTSMLAVPTDVFNELGPQVQKLGEEAGCNVNLLPDLRFKLNGIHYSLPPDAYLGQVLGDVPSNLVMNFRKTNARCQAAMMSIDLPSKVGKSWIFGMPFFRNFYTVFVQDEAKPRIYTAPATSECYPSAQTALKLKRQSVQMARHIDASKLRVSPWLSKHIGTSKEQRLPEETRRRLQPSLQRMKD